MMGDEIETTAQLIALAELRDVIVDELVACRVASSDQEGFSLPPEELRAPGSDGDGAALRFGIRLQGNELAVSCQVQTGNAYGRFQVGGEAVFGLPAPVSPGKPEVVQQFVEKVGAPTLFPYIRAAVASLAAQMSIPAEPLPLLQAGDLVLTPDEDPVDDGPQSNGPLVSGTFAKTNEDGTTEHLGEFFVDAQTGSVVRFGGEGQTPEVDEILDVFSSLPPPEEVTVEWIFRNHGEEWARNAIELVRGAEGDVVADAMLAELEALLLRIAAEDAVEDLGQALGGLAEEVAMARQVLDSVGSAHNGDEREALVALIAAAENVIRWAEE